MAQECGTVITGVGGALPAEALSNGEFIQMAGIDSSDDWIRARTHITQRHWAGAGETAATLGVAASRQALESTDPSDLRGVYVASLTPDQPSPSTATVIHRDLRLPETALAMDLSAACAGAVYALRLASNELQSGQPGDRALVVGAEIVSKVVDSTDRRSAILFGDGAGALAITARPEAAPTYAAFLTRPDKEAIQIPGGGTLQPAEGPDDPRAKIHMDGKLVRQHALDLMPRAAVSVAQQAGIWTSEKGIDFRDIHAFVPHQANGALIDEVGECLNVPPELCIKTVDQHANTSSASIPLALWDAVESGRFERGQRYRILMTAIGAGMVAGAMLIDLKLSEV